MFLQVIMRVVHPQFIDKTPFTGREIRHPFTRREFHSDGYNGFSTILGLLFSLFLGIVIWGLIFWALLG